MPETRPIPRSALNVLPLKERMKIIRRHMPELDPQVRSRVDIRQPNGRVRLRMKRLWDNPRR